jgi:hypothetical protein
MQRSFLACLFKTLAYPYLNNGLPGHARTFL